MDDNPSNGSIAEKNENVDDQSIEDETDVFDDDYMDQYEYADFEVVDCYDEEEVCAREAGQACGAVSDNYWFDERKGNDRYYSEG